MAPIIRIKSNRRPPNFVWTKEAEKNCLLNNPHELAVSRDEVEWVLQTGFCRVILKKNSPLAEKGLLCAAIATYKGNPDRLMFVVYEDAEEDFRYGVLTPIWARWMKPEERECYISFPRDKNMKKLPALDNWAEIKKLIESGLGDYNFRKKGDHHVPKPGRPKKQLSVEKNKLLGWKADLPKKNPSC